MLASNQTGTVSGAGATAQKSVTKPDADRYTAYSYSYPHKTAYRAFPQKLSLKSIWQDERSDSLFLYLHIPFCEMRCGFCNLFTTTNAETSLERAYLDQLERQAERVASALGQSSFARMALGGGTPTFLEAEDLDRLFEIVRRVFGADPRIAPTSAETSPYTSEPAKLAVLKDRGVERISIGIQSFVESEVMAVGRSQNNAVVERALANISEFDFDVLNIDLMYGLPGQTPATWRHSLAQAVGYKPEQIYLYPLYIRPLTGLGRRGTAPDDRRAELYRQAREFLIDSGYTQVSMRMFERRSDQSNNQRPVYCCQDDGMVGLGCGARSYTSSLHYSTHYAVEQQPVKQILRDYVDAPVDSFDYAEYGCVLTESEQKRRFLIQSLLQMEGLSFEDYRKRFGASAKVDFASELSDLFHLGMIESGGGKIRLTELGLEWSDRIGYELYSSNVLNRMAEYEGS